ncbi:hypothetical protein BDY24DRAFT_393052 [Mrakia frigida]|uniref:uncharacterized protein n=1 Tax=Mrakia frigida TaxID=29902 RepID=UPI003FCC09BE
MSFLFVAVHHLYPHLSLSINWDNVERLILFAHKYSIDSLLPLCISFLFSYAAGNPIKAMSIAELLSLPDVYKEASKFVLDNLPGWNQAELGTLSHETRWKLEKKRSWFLERLLKLSLNNVARDYPCAPTCPDPTHCSRLLDEKWRQAYLSANRFGSPQPSIVYRYLRSLDVPPFLLLERSACDSFARGWVLDLFDRMFSLPLVSNSTGPGVVLLNNSKYFLSIPLH